jgi:hypothetical protein
MRIFPYCDKEAAILPPPNEHTLFKQNLNADFVDVTRKQNSFNSNKIHAYCFDFLLGKEGFLRRSH